MRLFDPKAFYGDLAQFRFVRIDGDGVAIGAGLCTGRDLKAQQLPGERLLVLEPNERGPATDRTERWDSEQGRFRPYVPAALLASLRPGVLAKIDEAAEGARSEGITPGAGQAEEYAATEAEARRYLEGRLDRPPPTAGGQFPMLAAEMAARADPDLDAADVAAAIVTKAEARRARLAEIKELRRRAKLAAEAATTLDELQAAARIDWPRI